MADLFVTVFSIVPKPSTVTTGGPRNNNLDNNGLFTTIQQPQVQTPGNQK
jgi:hypothetical protein